MQEHPVPLKQFFFSIEFLFSKANLSRDIETLSISNQRKDFTEAIAYLNNLIKDKAFS